LSALEVQGVTVGFGGLLALDGVDLDVPRGTVTGLIGPNGAGKTTLFNVICGLQSTRAGRVRIDGRDVSKLAPHRRARRGLARTFQRLETFGSLSVHDNVMVAWELAQDPLRIRGPRGKQRTVHEVLERVGIAHIAGEYVDALPTGLARLVELARALATSPTVLLLDEPSSGLDRPETEVMGDLLVELADEGLGVLLVEHDVALVMRTCVRIHVLEFGRIIAVGAPDEIKNDATVRVAYLGNERV